jgi:hypothetical protein
MDTTTEPTVGGVYAVNHSRKGKFQMRVDRIDGEWVEGVIVSGTAQAMLDYNVRETGEDITVRTCLATFTLINPS